MDWFYIGTVQYFCDRVSLIYLVTFGGFTNIFSARKNETIGGFMIFGKKEN